ncbi:hypothetical protein F4777DRAFT_600438 [Nemania sp. FL0916]|nr:hypothetical protein F4777DRAFT_600438 [Nemania sp. FL0916]
MDWINDSQIFANADDFVSDSEPKGPEGSCRVLKNYKRDGDGEPERVTNVADRRFPDQWDGFYPLSPERDKWIKSLDDSMSDGYCILFIPRAADTKFGSSSSPSYFTSIPITTEAWEDIMEHFYLPAHYSKVVERGVASVVSIRRTTEHKGPVWMQVGTTTPAATEGYAFASTHFESQRFTYAIMVGCSVAQIDKVRKLLSSFEDSSKHPLLMLGIFAELELRRLEELVSRQKGSYNYLIKRLEGQQGGTSTSRFSWDVVRDVLETRDEFQSAEAEIEAAKRQMENGCIRQVDELWERYQKKKKKPQEEGNTPSDEAEERLNEVTRLFSERFHDILLRLEGLGAQCRLRAENISTRTELIRSQLAWQEAHTSAQNTEIGTLIAIMALVYLPVTGVATILAMPIFGWANDWRDVHFKSVKADGGSNGTSLNGGTSSLPVVSGYVWVFAALSALLLITTLGIFWCCIYRIRGHRHPNDTMAIDPEKQIPSPKGLAGWPLFSRLRPNATVTEMINQIHVSFKRNGASSSSRSPRIAMQVIETPRES